MIQLLQTPAAGARVPPGRGLQSAYLSAPTGRTKSALIVTQDFSPGRPRSGAGRRGVGGRRVGRRRAGRRGAGGRGVERRGAAAAVAEGSPTTQKRIPAKLISFSKNRRRPTLPLLRSTIGAAGLNFSVRNGKRWDPCAVTT